MPTNEFHSLLQKVNNEHIIFYDVMYRKNKIQMNQFNYSLLEVLVQVNFHINFFSSSFDTFL